MLVKLKSGEKVRAVIEEAALISGFVRQLEDGGRVPMDGPWLHTAFPSDKLTDLSIAGTMNVREQWR